MGYPELIEEFIAYHCIRMLLAGVRCSCSVEMGDELTETRVVRVRCYAHLQSISTLIFLDRRNCIVKYVLTANKLPRIKTKY